MSSYVPFSLLAAWSEDQQAKFMDGLRRATFTDGATIFERGDKSVAAYFILRGAVKSLNFNANGKISYFRLRHAGDCFGYYGVISEQPRTATMMAVGEIELATIPGPDFFTLVLENPEIGRPFLKLITGLLRIETDRLTDLTTLSTEQRVAAEFARQGQSVEVIALPDRMEFASYLGMTRETLSRTLNDLSRQDLIKVDGREVTIINKAALKALAEGDNT